MPQKSKDIINKKLETLEIRISSLGLFISIIDRYFSGFMITHETLPFAIIINEFVRHLYGQIIVILFDKHKNYDVVSIKQLHLDIVNNQNEASVFKKNLDQNTTKISNIESRFEKERLEKISRLFNQTSEKIQNLEGKYLNRLKKFRDKNYAHIELIDESEKQKLEVEPTWNELKELIRLAEEITKNLALYWNDCEPDFLHAYYAEYSEKFWNLVKLF